MDSAKGSSGSDRQRRKRKETKMSDENWISPDKATDPTIFDGLPVIVRARVGQEVQGKLHLKDRNHDGQVVIFVSYNSAPFPDMCRNETFFLTQDQLDEYQEKGSACVLVPPMQQSN